MTNRAVPCPLDAANPIASLPLGADPFRRDDHGRQLYKYRWASFMNPPRCEAFRPRLWVLDDDISDDPRTEKSVDPKLEGYGTAESTWSTGVTVGLSAAPGPEGSNRSENAFEEENDGISFERQTTEERIEGFEAYAYRSWRVVIYVVLNLLTCGLLYAALQSFPSTRVRFLCRRASSLSDASVLLVTFRRKKRQGRVHFFVVPTIPRARVSGNVLAAYLGRLSTRTVLGQTSRGRQTLQLLSKPADAALVIELRQRRYLMVELACPQLTGCGTRIVRHICLRIHSAFIPAFEEYYRLPSNTAGAFAPSMTSIPENETSLPVAGFQEEDEATWDSPTQQAGEASSQHPTGTDTQPEAEYDLPATVLPLRRPLGIHPWDADIIRIIIGDNCIDVEVIPLARLFLQCVTHPFFLFQFFSIALWVLEQYYYYSATIAFASFLSALLEALEMRSNAERLARIASSECELLAIRRPMSGLNGDRLERISSRELVPGDVVVIESGMIVPCDCTLLVGSAVVTEANLTGEASPLFKSPWRSAYEEPSSRLPRSRVDERQALAGDERSTLDHETESPAEEDDVTTDAADGDGDENEDDVLSTDEGESYFMGAYSASNEADDLLPTPAFHNMSVRVPDSWIHTQELRAGELKGTVTASLSPPSPSAPVSGSSEQSRHFHRQRRHHRRGRTLRMEYHRAHAVPEYHLAWDQPSHVLYAGTRVIEARPEMTIDNSGATSVSTCTNLERSSPSGAMSSAASTTAWSALGPPPDELDKQIDARVLAVVTRTRLDTAKGVLLHQILLADDETSRYERGRSSAERDAVRERPKSPLGVLLGIFSRPFLDSTESSSAITERPDSATMEKRLSQMYLDAYQAMIILLICGLFGAAYSFYILRPLLSFRETLLSALDLLTIVVPPAMPAAVTFGIVFALERLLAAHIFCIRPPAVLIASGLEVVCFDKTGTLTDLGLDVHELLPVAFLSLHPVPSLSAAADTISPMAGEVPSDTHVAFFDTEHALRQANGHAADQRRWMASIAGEALAPGLALVMGCCHTLAVVNGQVLGDEVDLRLFELTGYELWPSPREPDTKQWMGIQPAQALFYVVDPMTERSIARVVKVFAFSSEHARMGVIAQRIRRPEGSPPEVDWLFLVKGAPEVVVNLCDPQTVPNDFVHQVQMYTSQGLRVLALAGRRLASGGDARLHRPQHQAAFTVDVHGRRIPRSRTGEPTQTARARSARNLNPLTWSRRRLERSLTLYGLAVLENRLKPDTAAVLHELRIQGSLHCPMVTGDHIRTAVSVARQAGMMDRDARVIIADEASSHAEQGNRRPQTTSGRQSGRAGSTLAISGSGAEAGNQVVFYDSMHVHKRFSRMEVFSMLAGSSGMSAGPSSLARTFATASSAPAPATDWAATGTGVSSDAATVRESAEGAVPVSAVTSASTSGFPFESSLLHGANMSTRDAAWPPNRCSVRAGSNRDVAEPHEAVATASIRGDETSMSVQEFRGAGPVRPLDAALGSTEGVDVSLLPSRRHRVAGPGRPATTWALAGIPALTSFHDEEPVALAMTGAAFRILLREFHRLTANLSHQGRVTRPGRASSRRYHFLRQVFLRCAVYARMSAADKTALVHLLRSRFGLCVGMCGDGANDAGALREADVGIGLVERRLTASTGTAEAPDPAAKLRLESLRIEEPAPMTWSASTQDTSTSGATQAETSEAYPSRWTTQVRDSAPVHSAADDEDAVASLAAPFTSSVASIRAVVKVIAEGRGAAASSLACFRYMGIYSLTQSISTLVLYRLGTVYSDSQFLFQDLVLIMPLALTMGRTACEPRLTRHQPPVRLGSWYVCLSMALQSIVQAGFQASAIYVLYRQESTPDLSLGAACHWNAPCPAATVLFHVVNLQYIWSAMAFNIGYPFRQPWTRNASFRTTVAILLGLCLFLMHPLGPNVERIMGLAPLTLPMRRWLWVLVGSNALVTLALEWYLNWREHGHERDSEDS